MSILQIALRILDLLALAVAVPVVVNGVVTLSGLEGETTTDHWTQRWFHALDLRLRNLLDFWGNLGVLYLLVRLALWAGTSWDTPSSRALGAVGFSALVFAFYTPVIAGLNALLMLLVHNRPLDLDKERYFPLARRLEDPAVFADLRAEVAALMASTGRIPALTDVYSNITMSQQGPTADGSPGWGAWRAFFIRMQSIDVPVARAWLPRLFEELDQAPEVYNATLSILDPGRKLDLHRGHSKAKVRYHLGLIVPSVEDAWMDVGDARHHWREGEGVVFDDMYPHAATNQASSPRVVLFIDIWRRLPWPLSFCPSFLDWFGRYHPIVRMIRRRYDDAVVGFPASVEMATQPERTGDSLR